VVNNSGTLTQEYIFTDQQGNARFSFQESSGAISAKQENSYYPLGETYTSSTLSPPTVPNKKLVNGGSEWQNDMSNMPDYQQTLNRNYDAEIGRFVAVDPQPESAEDMTVYQYAGNNPVMMNDPDGAKATYGAGYGTNHAVTGFGNVNSPTEFDQADFINAEDSENLTAILSGGSNVGFWNSALSLVADISDSLPDNPGGYNLSMSLNTFFAGVAMENAYNDPQELNKIADAATSGARLNYSNGVLSWQGLVITGGPSSSVEHNVKNVNYSMNFNADANQGDVTVAGRQEINEMNAKFTVNGINASGLEIIQVFMGSGGIYGNASFVDGGINSPYAKNYGHEAQPGTPYYLTPDEFNKGVSWSGTSGTLSVYDDENGGFLYNVSQFEDILVARNYNGSGVDRLLGGFTWGYSNGQPIVDGLINTFNPTVSNQAIQIIQHDYPNYKFTK
jgi:RHS repeat-associated protein